MLYVDYLRLFVGSSRYGIAHAMRSLRDEYLVYFIFQLDKETQSEQSQN